MNSVQLMGRLTKDPEIRTTQGTQMSVATFTLAIDRPVKEGTEKQTDFPRVIVFGRTAESCAKYLAKGKRVIVLGRIQTGSYQNKEGATVYTTDVVANRVEFVDWNDDSARRAAPAPAPAPAQQEKPAEQSTPVFEALDEDEDF